MAFSFTIGDPARPSNIRPRSPSGTSSESVSQAAAAEDSDWETLLQEAKEAKDAQLTQPDPDEDKDGSEDDDWLERRRRSERDRERERASQYSEWEAYIRSAWNSPPDDPVHQFPPPPTPFADHRHPAALTLPRQRQRSPQPQGRQSKAALARAEVRRIAEKELHASFRSLPPPSLPPPAAKARLRLPHEMFRPTMCCDDDDDSPAASPSAARRPNSTHASPKHSPAKAQGGMTPTKAYQSLESPQPGASPSAKGYPRERWREEVRKLPSPLKPSPFPSLDARHFPPLIDLHHRSRSRPTTPDQDKAAGSWWPSAEVEVGDLLGLGLPEPLALAGPAGPGPAHHHPFDILD